MQFLNDLKVKNKLFFLIIILLLCIISIGSVSYYFQKKATQSLSDMYNVSMHAVRVLDDARFAARNIDSYVYVLMITKDPSAVEQLKGLISQQDVQLDKSLDDISAMELAPATRNALNNVKQTEAEYKTVRTQVIAIASENKPDAHQLAFQYYMKNGVGLVDKFNADLQTIRQRAVESAQQINQENTKDAHMASLSLLLITIGAVLLGLLVGLLIMRQITKGISTIVKCIDTVAEGNFSVQIPTQELNEDNEFGEVLRGMHKLKNNISTLLRQLTEAANQLVTSTDGLNQSAQQSAQASNQVANSVTSVADSAEKQLSQINSATNVIKQISDAVQHATDNSKKVAQASDQTAKTAGNGEESIKHAVAQMKVIEDKTTSTATVIAELEEESKQIGQIVDVISGIAGQTNLLALNAAIEAARAGEAGKGFAVVAEEVRKLAEQSQDAAKQITTLIEHIQEKTNSAVSFMDDSKNEVHTGADVVAAAGANFTQIVQMVVAITEQIRDISAGAEHVQSIIGDVVVATEQIDSESKKASEETQTISAATEEQSASIEEIASSSQSLSQMAEKLQTAIKKFKI